MRDLHVVGLSEDGRHVLLATTRDAVRGGFRVPLDERLVAAVKGELPRPGETGPPENPMSVKEIQARLRAGESVEELARAGGVPLSRVERFAGPVLSERAQVVEAARRAVLVRGRRGASALPLGEAVDLRLSELPSMRADSVEWTAFKGDDGRWTVQVSWFSRGRTRQAQWLYDVAARTVTSVDPGSASLAHVDPSGRRSAPDGDAAPAPARTARSRPRAALTAAAAGPTGASVRPAAKSASAGRPTSAGRPAASGGRPAAPAARPAARPAAPAARATPATPARPAAASRTVTPAPARPAVAAGPAGPAVTPAAARGTTAARRASGDETTLRTELPADVVEETPVVTQEHETTREPAAEAAPEAPTEPVAEVDAPEDGAPEDDAPEDDAPEVPAPAGPPALRVVPPPVEEEAPKPARRGRASVPTWADVLLSTAPPKEQQDD